MVFVKQPIYPELSRSGQSPEVFLQVGWLSCHPTKCQTTEAWQCPLLGQHAVMIGQEHYNGCIGSGCFAVQLQGSNLPVTVMVFLIWRQHAAVALTMPSWWARNTVVVVLFTGMPDTIPVTSCQQESTEDRCVNIKNVQNKHSLWK